MSAQVHHRTFEAQLEQKEGRIVEGCVVPYGVASRVSDDGGPTYFEVFEPGAFRKQLRAAGRVELRYEHHDRHVGDSLGLCRELTEESSGLYGVFTVHRGAFGDQALELIREGVLPGFSVGFEDRFTHWQRTAEGTVVRSNCLLREVSLCRTPAYAGAVITATRSRDEALAEFNVPTIDDEQRERLRAVGITI
jgi:HK97 family phage prohead protease